MRSALDHNHRASEAAARDREQRAGKARPEDGDVEAARSAHREPPQAGHETGGGTAWTRFIA